MPSRTRAFSLLEVITTTAVIAILAAIALPYSYQSQLNAKQSEIRTNLSSLAAAVVAYEASYDITPQADMHPRAFVALDKGSAPWDPVPADWAGLEWRPDGEVRASYAVAPDVFLADGLYVHAMSDLDNDGQPYWAMWFRREGADDWDIIEDLSCASPPCY